MLYLSSDWFLVFFDQAKPKYLIYFFLDKKKSPKCIISISRDCKETRQPDLIDQQTLRFDVDWLVLTSYETDRDRRHVSPQWWGICSAR